MATGNVVPTKREEELELANQELMEENEGLKDSMKTLLMKPKGGKNLSKLAKLKKEARTILHKNTQLISLIIAEMESEQKVYSFLAQFHKQVEDHTNVMKNIELEKERIKNAKTAEENQKKALAKAKEAKRRDKDTVIAERVAKALKKPDEKNKEVNNELKKQNR